MDILLDTHSALWILNGDKIISPKVRLLLSDPSIKKFISDVSFWEIAIKVSIGKLEINHPLNDLPDFFINSGFTILSIATTYTLAVATLPFHHKDPFDRLLIAQAQIENLALISKDANFKFYPVQVIW